MQELILTAVFSIWIVATILAHFPRFAVLRQYDIPGIIPAWNFFAPSPGQYSYYLLVRYFPKEGQATQWREIHSPDNNMWYSAVWHPKRRIKKALIDATSSIGEMARCSDIRVLRYSLPYLFFAAIAESEKPDQTMIACQFSILACHSKNPEGDFFPLLVSEVFKLSAVYEPRRSV